MLDKLLLEAQVKSLEGGEFEVVASTNQIDRMGDQINPNGWYLTNYKKNPVMLWAHDSHRPSVAKATKIWIEDDKLKAKGMFAPTPFAQELRVLVENKFLNAVSVGFLPLIQDEKGNINIEEKMYRRATGEELMKMVDKTNIYDKDGIKFEKQELLEISWVNVPALPQALVAARKLNLDFIVKSLEINVEEKDAFEKPYPNEHSCRLENPGKYDRFARKNCAAKHDGKCIDFIFGIKAGKSELQAMRYDKEIWTESSARTHCKNSDGAFEPASKELEIEKEGRVLSAKNRTLIHNCISQMGEAIDVLEELLIATEPAKNIAPIKDKGRSFLKADESKNAELLLLKRVSVALDDILWSFKRNKTNNSSEVSLLRIADKVVEATLKKLRQKSY